MAELKVISLNMFWGLGYPSSSANQAIKSLQYFYPKNTNLGAISGFLNKETPDIVALQEVDNGSRRNFMNNQVESISKNTSLSNTYFVAEKNNFGFSNDGNAILSKYKFNQVASSNLPYWFEKRNYIMANITVGGKQIIIFNTHLAAHKYIFKKERLSQIMNITKAINSMEGSIIVVGDFNFGLNSEEHTLFASQTKLRPIITQPTYRSFAPSEYYDQIWVSADVTIKEAGRLDYKISDHYPVYVKLEFKW